MNNFDRRAAARWAFALGAAGVLAGCAATGVAGPPDLEQRIANARTRADHEALAGHYIGEAAKARSAAEQHRKMARAYQARPIGERGSAGMVSHCNGLVQSFESAAAQFEQLAAAHKQMAEGAGG